MQPYGKDRCRVRGEQVVLLSSTVKPWQARVPATRTTVAHPGTAVDWDDRWFEVVAAEPAAEGARYVLEPWCEENAMRHVVRYDETTELATIADAARAHRQRKASAAARVSSVLLGLLPRPVQEHVGDSLGLRPSRMTLLSTIPGYLLFAYCAWRIAGGVMGHGPALPPALVVVAIALFFDSLVRFLVGMSNDRGIGSIAGVPLYVVLWALTPAPWEWPSPFGGAGSSTRALPASPEVAYADSVRLRAPLLTLLAVEDQQRISERSGLRFASHALPTAWVMLLCAAAGVVSTLMTLTDEFRLSLALSLLLAVAVVIDQLRRIPRLRQGPVPSLFAPLLRRFARDLL